jgi:hypothetical protein
VTVTAFVTRLLLLIVLLSFLPGRAGAQRAGDPRVEIETAGPARQIEPLESVLRELIGHLRLTPHYSQAEGVDPRVVVIPAADARPALARVWIDLSQPARATVYVVDGPWDRVLVRHVPLERGIDEVVREEIAQIVSATLDALASGARIGLTREEVERELLGSSGRREPGRAGTPPDGSAEPEAGSARPPPGSADPASAPPPEDYRARDIYAFEAPPIDAPPLDLGMYYELQAWSGDRLAHGPAAAVRSAFRKGRGGPGILLSAQYRFAVTVDEPPIGVRLHSGAGRVLGTYDFPIATRSELRAGLGLGLDLVEIEPRQQATGGDVRVAPERTTLLPVARALAAVQHRILSGTLVTAAVALDLELVDASYHVDRPAGRQPVFDPWTLRPAMIVGIASYLIP